MNLITGKHTCEYNCNHRQRTYTCNYYVVKKSETNFSNPTVLFIPGSDVKSCTSFLRGQFYLLTYADILY